MNIGKDTVPITASNFQSMSDRNWRTSLLVPFATNVAAVFYRYDRFYLFNPFFLLLRYLAISHYFYTLYFLPIILLLENNRKNFLVLVATPTIRPLRSPSI